MKIVPIFYKNGVTVLETDGPSHVMYSHSIYKIKQIETGYIYSKAIDVYPSRYTYELSEELNDTLEEDLIPDKNTLEGARALKISECELWNKGEDVCSFYFNGLSMWLSREERSDLLATLNSAQLLGYQSYEFSFKGINVELPLTLGFELLASIQLYASSTESIKQRYLVEIGNLTTIDEINNFNYKAEYPNKLKFNL